MVDRSRSGAACRTVHQLRTIEGILPRGSHGTILYEMDNVGRWLIFVAWNNGMRVPVFPDDIEVPEQAEARL